MQTLRLAVVAALWAMAVTLMTVATFAHDAPVLAEWSLLVACAASVTSAWAILERVAERTANMIRDERDYTEALVTSVACKLADAELPRIPDRR